MASKEALLREVLKLSAKERADVAIELLASLESLPMAEADEIEREWGAEIERRARRVLAGESAGVAWETIERDVRETLGRAVSRVLAINTEADLEDELRPG